MNKKVLEHVVNMVNNMYIFCGVDCISKLDLEDLKSGNLVGSNGDIVKNFYNCMLGSVAMELSNESFNVKTQFGVKRIENFKCNSYINDKVSGIICEYILENKIKYNDMTTIEMLENVDIGLIVVDNKMYCNIDKDTAHFISELNFDKYLLRLACGYLERLNVYDSRKFIGDYIKLCKGYESKRRLLGSDISSLEFELKRKYNSVVIENIGEINLDNYYNELVRAVVMEVEGVECNRADGYDSYIGIVKNCIDSCMCYGEIVVFCKMIKEKFNGPKYILSHLDISNRMRDRVTNVIGGCCEILNEISVDIIGKHLNIDSRRLLWRLLSDIKIEEAIELGISDRDNLGMVYYNEYSFELYSDCSTKVLIDKIVKEELGIK